MRAKILASFIIMFLIGLLVALFFDSSPNNWLIIALVLIISSFFVFKNRLFWTLVFGIGCLFLAVSLFQNQEIKFKDLNKQSIGKKEIIGTVYEIPSNTALGVSARVHLETGETFLVYLRSYPSVKYGDILKINGTIKEYSPDKENYLIKEKLAGEINANEFTVIGKNKSFLVQARGILFWFRSRMNLEISKALPKEEAGLASGLILGEKTLVSAELKRELQASGTSHIIALSGYNITIVLGLFAFLKTRASRFMNLFIPAIFILSFVIMTGAAASIVRAAIMGFMPIIARYIGRPANSFMAILFSAFLMVLFNPFIVLYDVGFQLSFMAMIGLVYISPLISKLFLKQNYLVEVFSQTMSAQIAVLPLIVFYFGLFSIVAPISNLIILSLVPTGMLLSFLVGFSGIISPLLGRFMALISFPILKLFNVLISFFGNLSFSAIQLKIDNPVWILILYLIVFDLVFLAKKHQDHVLLASEKE